MIKTEEELMGLEYDWLACDADGCVALFTTAGRGYAPVELRRDTDLYLRTIELILTDQTDHLGGSGGAFPIGKVQIDPRNGNRYRDGEEKYLFRHPSDYKCFGEFENWLLH